MLLHRLKRSSILKYTRAGATLRRRPGTYSTAEAAKRLSVSKQTLLRWFAERKIADVGRDHRGWRVFTENDLQRIKEEVLGNGT